MLGFECGLRASEVGMLRKDDFNPSKGNIAPIMVYCF